MSQLALDDLTVEMLYVLPTLGKPAIGIHWKLSLGFLMATCEDMTKSVWSLSTGRLERANIPEAEPFDLFRQGGTSGTTWLRLPESSEGNENERRKYMSSAVLLSSNSVAGKPTGSAASEGAHDPGTETHTPGSGRGGMDKGAGWRKSENGSFEGSSAAVASSLYNGGGGFVSNVEEFVKSFRQPALPRSDAERCDSLLAPGQQALESGHADFAKVVPVSLSPRNAASNMNTLVTNRLGIIEYGNELCSGLAPTSLVGCSHGNKHARGTPLPHDCSVEGGGNMWGDTSTSPVTTERSKRPYSRPAAQVLMVNIEHLSVRLKAKLSRESNSQEPSTAPTRKEPLLPEGDAGCCGRRKVNKYFRSLEQVVMSCTLVWGLDEGIDRLCESLLGLERPGPRVSFGHHGSGSAMTLLAPGRCDGRARWTLSPFVSAVTTMTVMALSMALMQSHPSFQALFGSMIPLYATVVPEKLLRSQATYTEPSLTLLSQYSLMAWEEGHLTARQLLEATLSRRGSHSRQAIAAEWSRKLQSHILSGDRSGMRGGGAGGGGGAMYHSAFWGDAEVGLGDTECDVLFDRYGDEEQRRQKHKSHLVLVLTVVGLLEPNAIDKSTAKHITVALMTQLHSDVVSSALAVELLSKGLHMWRPHIADLHSLIWSLLQLSASSDPTDSEIETGHAPPARDLVALSNAAQKTALEICITDIPCFLKTAFVEVRGSSLAAGFGSFALGA
jgi:hypothetical protein